MKRWFIALYVLSAGVAVGAAGEYADKCAPEAPLTDFVIIIGGVGLALLYLLWILRIFRMLK